jgi:hypothetical protein
MAGLTEQQLFDIVQKVYPDLEPALDFFSPFDCYSDTHNLYIELKCRRTHYPTLLLERLKYNRLLESAATMKMKPIYICSTPDGIWRFDLLDLKLKWQIEMLPRTTDFEDNEKVSKIVCYLPIIQGTKLPDRFMPKWNV